MEWTKSYGLCNNVGKGEIVKMNIQIFGTKKCNDTKKAVDTRISSGNMEDVVII